MNAIGNFPQIIHKRFASLSINLIDLLIISCIPIWTYPLYQKNKGINAKQITFINITALCTLLLTSVVAFIALTIFVKPVSPFLPQYYVFMPFSFFPTTILIAGMVLTYFLFAVTDLKKKD